MRRRDLFTTPFSLELCVDTQINLTPHTPNFILRLSAGPVSVRTVTVIRVEAPVVVCREPIETLPYHTFLWASATIPLLFLSYSTGLRAPPSIPACSVSIEVN